MPDKPELFVDLLTREDLDVEKVEMHRVRVGSEVEDAPDANRVVNYGLGRRFRVVDPSCAEWQERESARFPISVRSLPVLHARREPGWLDHFVQGQLDGNGIIT